MNKEIKEKFRERYKHLPVMVFQRSCEYARTPGELFDILETIPDYPFYWNEEERRWIRMEDVLEVK